MSRSCDFWESMVSATLMQSKYADTPVIRWSIRACAIACKITVSNTSGLYWEFHNIQYRRRGLSRQKDNIPCFCLTPILEGKFLSKKVRLIYAQIRYLCMKEICFGFMFENFTYFYNESHSIYTFSLVTKLMLIIWNCTYLTTGVLKMWPTGCIQICRFVLGGTHTLL
jgi:hypothetical protein